MPTHRVTRQLELIIELLVEAGSDELTPEHAVQLHAESVEAIKSCLARVMPGVIIETADSLHGLDDEATLAPLTRKTLVETPLDSLTGPDLLIAKYPEPDNPDPYPEHYERRDGAWVINQRSFPARLRQLGDGHDGHDK